MKLEALPRRLFDHNLIIFVAKNHVDSRPKPFQSLDWWEHEEFGNFVSEAWSEISDSLIVCELKSSKGRIN